MRLCQAHALITAAHALETANIGIEMHPFDVDEYTAPHITSDHMAGYVEFNDPDNPDRDTRRYNIDIYPGPNDDEIAVYVTVGFGPNGQSLLAEAFDARSREENADRYEDGSAEIVVRVVTAIRAHEKPFQDAYAARTSQTPEPQS